MYPYDIFLGLDLYSIFLCVGVFVCILTFSKLADALSLSARLQKFCYICAMLAIPLGYGSAVLFQAFYNYLDDGIFVISQSTGATFFGGLLGGAGVFLLAYFVGGRFMFSDGYHKKSFFGVANAASASIAVAHALGRIGCLMAGCCHGMTTDSWYGIYMHGSFGYQKYVPVQLFEALFLFALFGFIVYRIYRGGSLCLPIYMTVYGVWRFFAEYLRADDRGQSPVSFLSPSQLTAVLLVLGGAALLMFQLYYERRCKQGTDSNEIAEPESQNGGEA